MNRKFRFLFTRFLQSVAFWTLAMFCYAVFRFYGVDQEIGVTIHEAFQDNIFVQPMIFLLMLGFGLGVFYTFLDLVIEKFISKKIPLGLNLLLKTILYFIVTVFMATIVITFAYTIFDLDLSLESGWWYRDKRFWAMLLYIVLASLVYSFLTIAAERFGRGMFLKMMVGRYKSPKEEKRIFMFLDLKDSTTIAERLGHYRYSEFIQDCFIDLNEKVLDYEAEIYQYVGDEVVLSWPYEKGILNNNCVQLFFAFKKQLASRKDYYNKKYLTFPEFKAGVHGGALMVAEVGFIKKELAYHGDVINTSARIQAACNKYNVSFLLSEKILEDLKFDKKAKSRSLGDVKLKGKKKDVKIHTIITNG